MDFAIDHTDGLATAQRGDLRIAVRGDGAKCFHRRAIHVLPSGEEARESMLVCELAGVRMYFTESGIVMSKEDLYL